MTQTAQRLLADIRELGPHITSRAAEIEAGRRIPLDLVEALRSTGVFRMFVPQSHGGLELDLPAALAHLIHTDWRSYIYYVPGTMCPHFGSCRQDRVSDRICEALEVDRRGFAGALAPRFSLGAG
jgi:alkylation response protein AidB-like acyl-CoA dehydrogenase